MLPWRILLQHLAPQHGLTWLAGKLSHCTCPRFTNFLLPWFIRRYGINIQEAASSQITDYANFNAFFTRYLKEGLRPQPTDPKAIASPADGSISQIGELQHDRILQAKGFDYSLLSLLGGSEALAKQFEGGHFATIYLSPKDYHRVHMPVRGTLQDCLFVPGKLFSVNTLTAQHVPNLFARNERLISIFKTEHGPVAVILVGAMLVGSISTVWQDETRSKTITHFPVPELTLERGQEMGHFKMGSTVILLFGPNQVSWDANWQAGQTIQLGQVLGQTKTDH